MVRAAGRINFVGHDHIGLTVHDSFKVPPPAQCLCLAALRRIASAAQASIAQTELPDTYELDASEMVRPATIVLLAWSC